VGIILAHPVGYSHFPSPHLARKMPRDFNTFCRSWRRVRTVCSRFARLCDPRATLLASPYSSPPRYTFFSLRKYSLRRISLRREFLQDRVKWVFIKLKALSHNPCVKAVCVRGKVMETRMQKQTRGDQKSALVLCAWCSRYIGIIRGAEGVSHGICLECKTRELARWRIRNPLAGSHGAHHARLPLAGVRMG
jgi:hypothetical protein